ncbi:MAG: GNAT family N-acetyltransferase [Novosphingobium sp.]
MTVQDVTKIVLRDMTEDDIPAVADLCFEQQWPHREEDLEKLLAIGGGLVAEADGKTCGTIMSWRFGQSFAMFGVIIVAGGTVLVNATDEGIPLYSKLGFVPMANILQHQGIAPVQPLVELRPGERVRPMGAADAGVLDALYSSATGMDRKAVLDALLADGNAVVLCREHVQTGFAVMRRFGRGWLIGPVVAPDATGAKALIAHWLGTQAGSFCRIDVPEATGLGDWLEGVGLPEVGHVTRMAFGPAPVPGDDVAIFGLAAQALG